MDFYCDLTLSSDGAGTIGDPWQWSQAVNTVNVSDDDIVHIRGAGSGEHTINIGVSANGSSGHPIVYQQWSGQTQGEFQRLRIIGTGDGFYSFIGLKWDYGSGLTSGTSLEVQYTGGGELSWDQCIYWGFRSSAYSGGDFFPYYVGNTGATYENIYACSFRDITASISITDGEFLHGWRSLRLNTVVPDSGRVMIIGNTFDRLGEDAINMVGCSNITTRSNTFSTTDPISNLYASWQSPGAATGTWAGHEGETITQDTSSSSGIYLGQFNGRLWFVADDISNVPVRTDTNIWRLDSDPSNIYWTPSGSGDNAHNDSFSCEGTCDDIIVERNYFNDITDVAGAKNEGQAVKFNSASITNAVFQNNIVNKWDTGTYAILIENVGSLDLNNNTIIAISNDAHSLRTIAVTAMNMYNNIMTGGVDSGGTVNHDYNIFKAAAGPWGVEANGLLSQDFLDAPSGNNRYFTDYTNGDYSSFDENSPQLDIGDNSNSPTDDIIGTVRPQNTIVDIGAYERIFIIIVVADNNFIEKKIFGEGAEIKVTNNTTRTMLFGETVFLDGWIGEVVNHDGISSGASGNINVNPSRHVSMGQVDPSGTFPTQKNPIYFNPQTDTTAGFWKDTSAIGLVSFKAEVIGSAPSATPPYIQYKPPYQIGDLVVIT